jgi:hypothetical protein
MPPKTVRLLPGIYAETVQVGTPTTSALEIVASGATIANATGALILTDGANVVARGGTYAGEVTCGPPGSFPRSGGALRDLTVTGRFIIDQCDAVVERVTVEVTNGISLGVTSSPVIQLDAVRILRNAPAVISVVDATVTIMNSVLEVPIRLGTGSSSSTVRAGFNTMVSAVVNQLPGLEWRTSLGRVRCEISV